MNNDKFTAWLRNLVDACLPFEIKKKILLLQPLTQEESKKFINVVQLAVQAKGLSDHQEMLSKLDEIKATVQTLNRKSLTNASKVQLILWLVSGKDPRFKPADNRTITAIKDHMVKEACTLIMKDANLSERSASEIVFNRYQNVPGAYENFEAFRKKVSRASGEFGT